jgi:hypothetical protein
MVILQFFFINQTKRFKYYFLFTDKIKSQINLLTRSQIKVILTVYNKKKLIQIQTLIYSTLNRVHENPKQTIL